MNFAELIRVIGRRWLVIAGFALLGIALSGFAVYKVGSGGLQPKNVSYCATAEVMIDQPGAQGAAAGAVLSRLLIVPQTYKSVIESAEVATRASELVDGVYAPEEIQEATGAEPLLATQVINISACGQSPTDAVRLTDAVSTGFGQWLDERQNQHNVLGPNRLETIVLSAPKAPGKPSGFPAWMWVFIGAFLGLTFGLVTAFGVESVASEEHLALGGHSDPAVPGGDGVNGRGGSLVPTSPGERMPSSTRRQ